MIKKEKFPCWGNAFEKLSFVQLNNREKRHKNTCNENLLSAVFVYLHGSLMERKSMTEYPARRKGESAMKILLWLILLVLCWPVALLALVLYPVIWLILLPFRLLGITVGAVFDLFKTLITFPARILKRIA